MNRFAWWLFASLLAATPLGAGEVVTSHVAYENDHYLVNIDMRINANADKVFMRLLDYDHLHRINGAIKSSRLLFSDGHHYRVRIVTRGCIWFYCRKVVQLQNIEKFPGHYLIGVVDPAHSDLKYGRMFWHVWRDGKGTRVSFSADVVPDFWVPPLIGPWVLKEKLLEEGRRTIGGLERLARRR